MKRLLILIFIITPLVAIVLYNNINTKQKNNLNLEKGSNAEVKVNTSSAETLTPERYQKMLSVGMDVDFAKTRKGVAFYSVQILKDFSAKGIKHIRIRIKDDATDEVLKQIQKVVDDSLKYNIIPIIAYQANNFKENPNDETLSSSVSWWSKVSTHFQHYPNLLSFDNMIEATDALNKSPEWQNKYQEEVTKEIRKTNPERIVFISPIVRSEPEQLELLKIPTESNGFVMAEFHFYASGPSKTNPSKLWTTGTEKEKNIIENKIEIAKKWSEKNNIKIWLGAWMPSDYNDGNDYTVEEQVKFASFVSCELKKNDIPHAVNSDTQFYSREKLQWISTLEPVVESIVNPKCE